MSGAAAAADHGETTYTDNTRHSAIVGSMLGKRLRRWHSIGPAMAHETMCQNCFNVEPTVTMVGSLTRTTQSGKSGDAVNPLTAGVAYSGFHFLLAHKVPHFKYVKDKM